jgi:hypothetical protein
MATTSTAPLTWFAALTVELVYPVWQLPQAEFWMWGAGGGEPWQVPHAAAATPPVQERELVAPEPVKLPWQ